MLANDYLLKVKVCLLLEGVRIDNSLNVHHRARKISISEGINLHIKPNVFVTVPINMESDNILKHDQNGYTLKIYDEQIEVQLITPPDLRGIMLEDTISLDKIGTIQIDRARVSAFKGCIFGALKTECKFCEIGDIRRLKKNKLDHIKAFVKHVDREYPQIQHYLVSGGTPSDFGWGHFIDVCNEIRTNSPKRIYAMFSPPPDLNIIKNIVDAGVSEIAINLEFYDRSVAEDIIPGKATISRQYYYDALNKSVQLLGSSGEVRSILIVGIESFEHTLRGVKELASMGVAPILSIFKPLSGTQLAHHPSPKLNDLLSLWYKADEICKSYSINLGPSCIQCQNNTLSIPTSNITSRN